MSASRMKNLILLVLTLCALGLLCIVVPNRLAQTHEQRQMLQELKTLYEGYDLSIDLDELPRSPTLYIVELSEDGAQTAAQALLGAKTAPAGASGFESTYESDLGTLHITRTGGFSASLTGGSRSIPVAGAAVLGVSDKIIEKGKLVAASAMSLVVACAAEPLAQSTLVSTASPSTSAHSDTAAVDLVAGEARGAQPIGLQPLRGGQGPAVAFRHGGLS